MYYAHPTTRFNFFNHIYFLPANAFNLDQSKIMSSGKELTLNQQALVFTCMQYKFYENTVGKGEIARNEQFLLFQQCFLPIQRTFSHFHQIS